MGSGFFEFDTRKKTNDVHAETAGRDSEDDGQVRSEIAVKALERMHRDLQLCSNYLRKIKNTFLVIAVFQFLILGAIAIFILYVFGIVGG